MISAPQKLTALAYSVPACYANLVQINHINGLCRLTFFEQHLSVDAAGLPHEVVLPRVSIMITMDTASFLITTLQELFTALQRVAEGAPAGATKQ